MEKEIKLLVKIILLLLANEVKSQNLVRNSSFEEFSKCPDRINQLERYVDWHTTGFGSTPEYFHKCSKFNPYVGYSVGVPENLGGIQEAKNGGAYVGLAIFASDDDFYYREYIQGTLEKSLEKGKQYIFTFFINLSEHSLIYSDRISICFCDTPKTSPLPHSILKCDNEVIVKGIDFQNTKDWIEVKGNYIAHGNEKFLTIGLFSGDLEKKEFDRLRKFNRIKNGEKHCYYYIDDVSLIEKDFSYQK